MPPETTTTEMTESQFAAHLRDLLSWILAHHDLPRRIARGTPMAANWAGTEKLRAEIAGGNGENATSHVFFHTEHRSGRTVAILHAHHPDGAITWQEDIPRHVIEASIARVTA